MKVALCLLMLAFGFAAQAQQRQPAQITTLPTTSPQEFDLLDNTGKWLPFGTGSGGMFLDTSRAISPTAFGAKCDGATDDTTALQAWAAATTDRAHLVVAGTCVFKGQIVFPPLAYGVTIEGNGHPGKLLYAGASTTLDPIIQIGERSAPSGCAAKGWAIKGLHFMSSTKMTAGDALRISDACNMQIDDLTVGGNLDGGNVNFFNALHLDGGNSVYTRGFGLQAGNAGLTVNGEADLSHQFTDAFFLHGYVVHSRIGVHICGGVGGFMADQTDVVSNGTNVLTDQACAAKANIQLFFGSMFASDATDPVGYPSEPQIGVHVSDPGSTGTHIYYQGWLASASKQCFVVDNMGVPAGSNGTPTISFLGAKIGNCHSPGSSNGGAIDNQNTHYKINVTGTRFFTNVSPTIYNVAGALPISIQSIMPEINFSITGAWDGLYDSAGGNLVGSAGAMFLTGQLNATVLTSTGGTSASVQFRPTTGTQPADSKNWDFYDDPTIGNLNLRSLKDDYSASNVFMTFTRGSGFSLTGAKTVFDTPVTAPALPTSAGSGGLYVCIDSTGALYKKVTCP